MTHFERIFENDGSRNVIIKTNFKEASIGMVHYDKSDKAIKEVTPHDAQKHLWVIVDIIPVD